MSKKKEEIFWSKAEELCGKMNLEEKIGMIHGAQLFQTEGIPRLGIPALKMSDGPMGVRQEFYPDSWETKNLNDDYVTYLPCNSALAATWNRELAYKTGQVLGAEARGRGKDVILGPGVNIKRSPLCGRNFEYFSEDPFLTGELASAYIKGVQENDVAACVKHFAVNNQETQRVEVEVEVEEKALRQMYLPAFEKAVKDGNAYTLMGAYNKLYGEYCCQNEYLLNEILRKEWDFDGVVISDWGAVHDTAKAAQSQLDIEMSVTYDFDEYYMAKPLQERIEKGDILESVIDEKVKRILVLMQRLHMLDGERKQGEYNTENHRRAALDVARESVVLLKNEEEILPLNEDKTKKLLVIGDNAKRLHAAGGGSAEIKALYEVSPLMGIKMFLGGNVHVDYAQGYCIDEVQGESDKNWQETSLNEGGGKISSEAKIDEKRKRKQEELRKKAVSMAREYDNIIFVGGLNHQQDSEGNDRADMKLPYEQDILIKELLEIHPDMVIVMVGGSPVEMGEWIGRAKAVIWSWYAGMEGGTALAETLFGKINPSGKLPETFYKNHMQCSAHSLGEFSGGEKVKYTEGCFVGYRYNDTFDVAPEFSFGHGLSYTTFEYTNLEILQKEGEIRVLVDIKNTGTRQGKEVVKVYLLSKTDKKIKPIRELKGFTKVDLLSGEEKRISIPLEGSCADGEIQVEL